MGVQDCIGSRDSADLQFFANRLRDDLKALERLLEDQRFERAHRIGAEQEMCFVDPSLRPAPIAQDVLSSVSDHRVTTELALFNMEVNASPRRFEAHCLREMEQELRELVATVQREADKHDARVLCTGILPTLRRGDLGLGSMTPVSRYMELNDALLRRQSKGFQIEIEGIDELHTHHDSVMFESANTSFQLHYQVDPDNFARLYNVAQLITAPLLACSANSPLFLGRRLWHETRVPLFHGAIDGNHSDQELCSDDRSTAQPRVVFGHGWHEGSVLDYFQRQVAEYEIILGPSQDEDSLAALDKGEVPKLRNLCAHNGTIYRWNRPCFGVMEGKPHLRIENRILPAGPTTTDQVANAALFFGLMAYHEKTGTVIGDEQLSFDKARANFVGAAREGLSAPIDWIDGKRHSARDLLLDTLIDQARQGLIEAGISADDVEHYLGVMEERVEAGQTGASWALDSLARVENVQEQAAMEQALVRELLGHQADDTPVGRWPLAKL